MVVYTLQQTLTAVGTLNKTDQPFEYRVEDNKIVGEWKYLDAVWAAPLAAGDVDKNFRVTVSLDEAAHTYTSKDYQSKKKSNISFNPLSGEISFGNTSESFSGQMIGKEIGFGLGRAKQAQNQTPVVEVAYQYNFAPAEIKEPLFNFLSQYGWTKGKSGFLSKLFGSK